MIFKKLPMFRFLSVICLSCLQMVVSCNRNPVGENFVDDKNPYVKDTVAINPFAMAQDAHGTLFMVDYKSISIVVNDSTVKSVFGLITRIGLKRNCGDIFIKDGNGSLIISIDSNLVLISKADSGYRFDSIGTFLNSYSSFRNRYAVDDDGDVWFSDEQDSSLYLIQWDGEKTTSYTTHFKAPDRFINARIAAGGGYVYCTYYLSDYSEVTDSYESTFIILKWNITERAGERVEIIDEEISVEKTFVINGRLHILLHREGEEMYEVDYLDNALLLKTMDIDLNDRYGLKLLKRNSEEVYLYSEKILVKVANVATVKELYSDCDALFLDTANQVILHNHYNNKFINVSELPGF